AILPAVPAVVFGYLAQGKIGRSGGKLGGIALAKAGMILGYVGIGFGVAMALVWALFVGGMAFYFSASRPGMPMGPVSGPPSLAAPPIAVEAELFGPEDTGNGQAGEDGEESDPGGMFELESDSGIPLDLPFDLEFGGPGDMELEVDGLIPEAEALPEQDSILDAEGIR
ncbi:MAG TPA: DUF4190 domain-containing protein, partial [Verrucomicrobiales bacterium]|nr:DUF4190 domain-containing protein [Verrucomicrobiales bacterium]